MTFPAIKKLLNKEHPKEDWVYYGICHNSITNLLGAVWDACIQLTSIQGDLSPLMLASQQGHADIVALLIENHADLDMQNEVHSAAES